MAANFRTVVELQQKILCIKSENRRVVQIDNAKLAAMTSGPRRQHSGGQLGDRLWIELEAEPTVGLVRVLEERRCQYEATVGTTRRDVARWFRAQKDCLQDSLCESEARHGTELAQTHGLISTVEEQLSETRADLERRNQGYQVLLDMRARLEGEINTYQKLLESEDCKLPCSPCTTPASSTPHPAPEACTSCSSCLPRPPWASCGPCSSPQC